MKKILLLVYISLLLFINSVNASNENTRNIKFYIPNNVNVLYHSYTYYKLNGFQIPKISWLLEKIISKVEEKKMKELLKNGLYVAGSDYKRKLFNIISENAYWEQPLWYFERNVADLYNNIKRKSNNI
jgi:hypothetical protein